jgi:hypothetical protein
MNNDSKFKVQSSGLDSDVLDTGNQPFQGVIICSDGAPSGLGFRLAHFRRALPCTDDCRAFSPSSNPAGLIVVDQKVTSGKSCLSGNEHTSRSRSPEVPKERNFHNRGSSTCGKTVYEQSA